jgi:hypothetical protein
LTFFSTRPLSAFLQEAKRGCHPSQTDAFESQLADKVEKVALFLANAQAADETVSKFIDEFDALIEGCVKLGMKVPSHDLARRKLASMKEHGAFAIAVDAFISFCTDATSYFGSLKELNILEVDVDTVDKFDVTGISDGAFELTSNSANAVLQMADACLSVVESPFVPLT